MATPLSPVLSAMPASVRFGKVRWTITSTYRPAGAAAPVAAAAVGVVKFEPKLDSMNVDSPQVTHLLTPTVMELDANGHLEVDLVADVDGRGWDYLVTPVIKIFNDAVQLVTPTATAVQPFGVHVTPGAVIDLDDVRPIGKIASTGQLVSQGKAGTGLTGDVVQDGTVVQFALSDGSYTEPVQLPVLNADGTTAAPASASTTDSGLTATDLTLGV